MKPSIELIRLIAVILIAFTHTRHNDLGPGFLFFVINTISPFGTAILSIISGYLYYSVSRKKKNLFSRKIKSLAIPYLIANVSVLAIVLIVSQIFNYDPLNRLSYDFSIILEGILALNSPPINPPTYFVRDIFVLFSIIALFTQKEYKALLVLIPIVLFGKLILRYDVALLFIIGLLYAKFEENIDKKVLIPITILVIIIVSVWLLDYLKIPIAFLVFILTLELKFKFFNTGRYSYLLHLYHSPIMVVTFPILSSFIINPILNIIAQIIVALISVYILFQIIKRYDSLKVLSGGR